MTTTRSSGNFFFSQNFEVQKEAPFDARSTTPLKSELTNDTLPFPYIGMLVAVTSDSSENNGLYILTASDATNVNNWEKVGSNSSNIIVDTDLNNTSANPVQNQAIKNAIDSISTFSGNYNDLTNKPSIFSGDYNDLTNKPTLTVGVGVGIANDAVLSQHIGDLSASLEWTKSEAFFGETFDNRMSMGMEMYNSTISVFKMDTYAQGSSTTVARPVWLCPRDDLSTNPELVNLKVGGSNTFANAKRVAVQPVGTSQLEDDSVTADKIADGSINAAKLDSLLTDTLANALQNFSGNYNDLTNKPTLTVGAGVGIADDAVLSQHIGNLSGGINWEITQSLLGGDTLINRMSMDIVQPNPAQVVFKMDMHSEGTATVQTGEFNSRPIWLCPYNVLESVNTNGDVVDVFVGGDNVFANARRVAVQPIGAAQLDPTLLETMTLKSTSTNKCLLINDDSSTPQEIAFFSNNGLKIDGFTRGISLGNKALNGCNIETNGAVVADGGINCSNGGIHVANNALTCGQINVQDANDQPAFTIPRVGASPRYVLAWPASGNTLEWRDPTQLIDTTVVLVETAYITTANISGTANIGTANIGTSTFTETPSFTNGLNMNGELSIGELNNIARLQFTVGINNDRSQGIYWNAQQHSPSGAYYYAIAREQGGWNIQRRLYIGWNHGTVFRSTYGGVAIQKHGTGTQTYIQYNRVDSPNFNTTSDAAVKHNERPITNALSVIDSLKPYRYWKTGMYKDEENGVLYGENHNFSEEELENLPEEDTKDEAGLIAQDLLETELAFTVTQTDELDDHGNRRPMAVDYNSVNAYLIKAVQELHFKVLLLESEIQQLKSQT